MRVTFILFVFSLVLSLGLQAQESSVDSLKAKADEILMSRGEVYLSIPKTQKKAFLPLVTDISPDRENDSSIYFYANKNQFRKVIDQGLSYRVLTAPSMLGPVKMALSADEVLLAKGYPTYPQYLELMLRFKTEYPEICRIDTIGYSIDGRLILAVRLQNGEYVRGDKPIVFISSSMHGDEPLGYPLMLMLINHFLENSQTSPQLSEILDKLVLIINPLSNPDGSYFYSDTTLYGSIRQNKNSVDLNRNFPYIRLGQPYSHTLLEKENEAMVNYMEKYRPSLSANLHGGAEVLNYPWDSWYSNELVHADNDWFIEICKDYVDTCRIRDPSYLDTYPEGYVFGGDWYKVFGGRQDFVTYYLKGRELTMELSDTKIPAASQLAFYWNLNRQAFVDLIQKAEFGIYGRVIDSISGENIAAKIEIPGYDKNESYIFSDSASGRFFRYLPGGVYNVQISASGYHSKNISAQVIPGERVQMLAALVPLDFNPNLPSQIIIRSLAGNEFEIELQNDESEVFTAEMYDLTGRKVQEKIFIGKTGIMGGLNLNGIYVLKVISDRQNVKRLVYIDFQ
ncbi:MAG: hypothetical protein H6538_02515 [Bacteroidales bacterium]|nr:hypothetical protein [Bacteroidales bacterium]MCB8999266.1 hypothetical protein [Bacteroidales bacterium]MCB9013066.1 hypothetical protein [Bacteroidales bacterium]